MKGEKYRQGLVISTIKDGTVIDHITGGEALNVLRIIGITGTTQEMVSIATNVKSTVMGKKDVVKIGNRELSREQVDRIALIAPRATINIVRDYDVVEKKGVSVPDTIIGIVRCPNPCCITNAGEPIQTRFVMEPRGLVCSYCDWVLSCDITSHFL
ncbi:MAG: aspartate carbamoyltransferase regulatory subunit [Methanospirillaceae archaeon]|nr:aspartate carbamoyltransferase regulatory subunit [Methanospirillaceae archaeon]